MGGGIEGDMWGSTLGRGERIGIFKTLLFLVKGYVETGEPFMLDGERKKFEEMQM
jgi:hypothetical protein